MNFFRRSAQPDSAARTTEYAPLSDQDVISDADAATLAEEPREAVVPFSWFEYGTFCYLGMAMLWSWCVLCLCSKRSEMLIQFRNMFLAASPYFASRFTGERWIETNFQSAIMTSSTVTSLAMIYTLTNMQKSASYPFRIASALVINVVVFSLLTVSTSMWLDAAPRAYFGFVIVMVICTSLGTALMQNGLFSFAASFSRPDYIRALVTGQAVAGVLPAIAQIASVLVFPPTQEKGLTASELAAKGQTSAFVYFLTAVTVSATALMLLVSLVRRHSRIVELLATEQLAESVASVEAPQQVTRKVVPISLLFRKLFWPACAIAMAFTVTLFFPVYTSRVVSVIPPSEASRLFQPYAFIPLGFLFWNMGDLLGRISSSIPVRGSDDPTNLFVFSILRIMQVPLYFLCNIDGDGAAIPSDLFYLLIVQIGFGFTSGWLCSKLMVLAPSMVDKTEREAAGSFMGLALTVGLFTGSVLSFVASNT